MESGKDGSSIFIIDSDLRECKQCVQTDPKFCLFLISSKSFQGFSYLKLLCTVNHFNVNISLSSNKPLYLSLPRYVLAQKAIQSVGGGVGGLKIHESYFCFYLGLHLVDGCTTSLLRPCGNTRIPMEIGMKDRQSLKYCRI